MKLLIADDHTLFRDALAQYILRAEPDADIDVAKDLAGVSQKLMSGASYDLVMLDLRMPGMNGLEGLKILRDKYSDQPAVLMSGVAEEKDVHAALEIGAVGYFPKTMSGRALLDGINQILAGEKFVPRGKTGRVMPSHFSDEQEKRAAGPDDLKRDFQFTPRESEVLRYLVDGASNKEIARSLDLQVVTVKLHVRGICRKLDVNNRTQAALKAKDLGVLAVSETL